MLTKEIKAMHKKFAVDLFNHAWELMDKTQRTLEETDEMIHAAHASRYHWGIAGSPINLARGEWQISRIYALLNRTEPCGYHARRCLDITLAHEIGDFDLAFAYEAMARAANLSSDAVETNKYLSLAQEAGKAIGDPADLKYFQAELDSIPVPT
jgi:hypothetical protein